MGAGGDHDVIHVGDVILPGDIGLFLRIDLAVVHVRAGVCVFVGQILERGVRRAREANDIDILLETGDGALGLVGKRIKLFAGEIEALMMAITEKINEPQDHDYQQGDGERIGAEAR